MNTVNLIGRLTADPELRSTLTGTAVTEFRLAVDNGPDNPTAFFTVMTWGRTAIAVATYQHRGQLVGFTGRLSCDRVGQGRSTAEPHVHHRFTSRVWTPQLRPLAHRHSLPTLTKASSRPAQWAGSRSTGPAPSGARSSTCPHVAMWR